MKWYRGLLASVTAAVFIGCSGSGGSSTAAVEYASLSVASELHNDVFETSGLAKVNGRLYTHNDSENSALLYEINATTGSVVRTITVLGATNVDWEDLACDDTYLYIADTGNNQGTRTDLKIYKVPKNALDANNTVIAEEIAFSYADQSSFEPAPLATPYDAEALIAYNGQLYIFTKNWEDYTSRYYTLPTAPGTYSVAPAGGQVFDVMVTGAAIDETNSTVALVGYTNPYNPATPYKSMIMMLRNFTGDDFFSGDIAKYTIVDPFTVGQVEAVLFKTPAELYLTSEGQAIDPVTYPAKLYTTQVSE